MKIITLTSFSESPLHLLTIDDAEILKKVVLHSVATALARSVFPVPWKVNIHMCIHRKKKPVATSSME